MNIQLYCTLIPDCTKLLVISCLPPPLTNLATGPALQSYALTVTTLTPNTQSGAIKVADNNPFPHLRPWTDAMYPWTTWGIMLVFLISSESCGNTKAWEKTIVRGMMTIRAINAHTLPQHLANTPLSDYLFYFVVFLYFPEVITDSEVWWLHPQHVHVVVVWARLVGGACVRLLWLLWMMPALYPVLCCLLTFIEGYRSYMTIGHNLWKKGNR